MKNPAAEMVAVETPETPMKKPLLNFSFYADTAVKRRLA